MRTERKETVQWTVLARGQVAGWLTLQRRDQNSAIQEDYEYGYYYGTNRLWHTAADDGDNYQYDPIGNLTKDVKEGCNCKLHLATTQRKFYT